MNLLWISCLLLGAVLANGNSISEITSGSPRYLLTYPQILSPTSNQLCLTFLDGNVPRNAPLKAYVYDPRTGVELGVSNYELTSASQCFALPTQGIRGQLVKLRINLSEVFDETKILPFRPSYGMTMIETSKPVYQPGEVLKFRAIGFDGWLKPWDESFNQVAVYNPSGFKVMQWKGVQLSSGLFHFELPLAEINEQGIWKIIAVTKSGETIEKTFQVSLKDEPQVKIRFEQGAKYFIANEESHLVKMCVEDKFGNPINSGVINYKLTLPSREAVAEQGFWPVTSNIELNREEHEHGCVSAIIKKSNLEQSGIDFTKHIGEPFYIYAAYSKSLGDKVLGAGDASIPIVRSGVHLRLPSSKFLKNYFKPGLPYFGYLMVEQPDYTPIKGAEVQVCYHALTQPWSLTSDVSRKPCKTFISGPKGEVTFILPPVTRETKQILIEATIVGLTGHKQLFPVNPWYSTSSDSGNFIIRPIVRDSHCNPREPTRFEVLMTLNGTQPFETLYLQRAGRVRGLKPVERITLRPVPWTADANLLIGQIPEGIVIYSDSLAFESFESDRSYSPLNRIILFGLDASGKLISDSLAFFKDCLRETSSNLISLAHGDSSQMASPITLSIDRPTPCSIVLSRDADVGTITERKIAKLLHRFDDVYAKTFEYDKCALERKQRSAQVKQRSYYTVPVLDVKNDWDIFKDMGVHAKDSAADLYSKPCEWDLIPAESYNASVAEYLALSHHLPYSVEYMESLADAAELARLAYEEARVSGELLDMAMVQPGQPINLKNLMAAKYHELHNIPTLNVHAICMDPKTGLRTGSIRKTTGPAPFSVNTDFPAVLEQGSERKFTLVLRREANPTKPEWTEGKCLSVGVGIAKKSDNIEVTLPEATCFCGKPVLSIPVTVKVTQTGPANLTLVIKDAQSADCADCLRFNRVTKVFSTMVLPKVPRVLKRSHDLMCHGKGAQIANFNQERDSAYVSSHLINALIDPRPTEIPVRTNILQVLSRYGPMVSLHKSFAEKSRLEDLIRKSYQELALFKLPDGSYSMFPGTNRISSLPATVLTFQILSAASERFGHASSEDLKLTWDWISANMFRDGCFRHKHYMFMPYSTWPFNHTLVSELEMSAFVGATLADTKGSRLIVRRVARCIDARKESQPMDDMTKAMVALIYAKLGKTSEAQSYLTELESAWALNRPLPGRFEPSLWQYYQNQYVNGEEVRAKAFYLMARVALDMENFEDTLIVRQLIAAPGSLNDPIVSYALARIWPRVMIGEGSSFRVEFEPGTSLYTGPFETKPAFLPSLSKIMVKPSASSVGGGCVIVTKIEETPVDQYSAYYPEEPSVEGYTVEPEWDSGNWDIEFQAKRGYKVRELAREFATCDHRMMKICSVVNVTAHSSPMYQIRFPAGYALDAEVLRREQFKRSSLVDYFTTDGSNAFITQGRIRSTNYSCIGVPFKSTQDLANLINQAAQITVLRYDMGDLTETPTVGVFTVPRDCVKREVNMIRTRRSVANAAADKAGRSAAPSAGSAAETSSQVARAAQSSSSVRSAPTGASAQSSRSEYEQQQYETPTYQQNTYEPPPYTPPVKGYPAPPVYEPAPYTPPAKGYAPPPVYEPAPYVPPPVYEPPSYQMPAYEPPVYSPPPYSPPVYQAPAYEPPTYQAPAYSPPAYEPAPYSPPPKGYPAPPVYEPAPYSPPVKGYAPPPVYEPAPYTPPAKGYPPPPVYEPAPYVPPPVYEPPPYVPPPPVYEPPTYQAPAYSPPAYSPPAYSPPAYQAPAYEPPAYQAPAYEPPAYQAPVYEPPPYSPPAKGYEPSYPPPPPVYEPPPYVPPPPVYEPPTYQAPVYAPPAYEPAPYQAPAYEPAPYSPPPKGYEPSYPPPPPVYEPPKTYVPPPPPVYEPSYNPYRNAQGRNAQARYQGAAQAARGQSQQGSRNQNTNTLQARSSQAAQANAARQMFARRTQQQQYSRFAQAQAQRNQYQYRRNFNGMALLSASRMTGATELVPVRVDSTCSINKVASSCPKCLSSVDMDVVDKMCEVPAIMGRNSALNATEKALCGNLDLTYVAGVNTTLIDAMPYTIPVGCSCDALYHENVLIVSPLFPAVSSEQSVTRIGAEEAIKHGKVFGDETIIMPATPQNVQDLFTSARDCESLK